MASVAAQHQHHNAARSACTLTVKLTPPEDTPVEEFFITTIPATVTRTLALDPGQVESPPCDFGSGSGSGD